MDRAVFGDRPHSNKKRSIKLNGHPTSVSVEDDFWEALIMIAEAKRMTLMDLVGRIDNERMTQNLSSSVRLFVLAEARGGRLGPKPTVHRPRSYRRVSSY